MLDNYLVCLSPPALKLYATLRRINTNTEDKTAAVRFYVFRFLRYLHIIKKPDEMKVLLCDGLPLLYLLRLFCGLAVLWPLPVFVFPPRSQLCNYLP